MRHAPPAIAFRNPPRRPEVSLQPSPSQDRDTRLPIAARIVGVYAVLTLAYIILSDRLLGAIVSTPGAVTRLQTMKGAMFVVLTSALLYILITRGLKRVDRANTAEREQFELLRGIVQGTTDAIAIQDADGRFLLVNANAERLIGRRADEITGRTAAEVFSPAVAARLADGRRAAIASGEAHTIEIDAEIEGDEIWMVTFSPYRNAQQAIAGVILVARDISGQRAIEDETRRSEARLRLFISQVPAIVWTVDQELRITSSKGAGLATLGRTPDQTVGLSLAEVYGTDDPLHPSLVAHRRALEGDSVTYEHTRGGRTFDCRVEPYRNTSGEITGVIGLAFDVTERTRGEALLREQEDLLRQAQKMEAVGRLAGGLAHDFNNLLTIITSSADFLGGSLEAQDPRRDDVQEIRRAADRAAVLVRELLAFSSQQILEPRALDVHELVTELRPRLARALTATTTLHVESEPDRHRVRADRRQLEQALVHLAMHAREAMPRGGTLTIAVSSVVLDQGRLVPALGRSVTPGPYVCLRVRDTGRGMDRATRARIFEPFFSARAPAKDSGLGLAVVYGIVAQSGGFIEVESEPTAGTEFRVYLPQLQGSVAESDAGPVPDDAAVARTGLTVLLAEDEPAVRRLARRVLEREGFTVLEAADGVEALERCEGRTGIDLVVSDVVMPRMGGRELIEECLTRFPGCRALMMSGYTDDELVRRDVLDSRAAFLPKPFTPDALVRKVRETLESAAAR